MSSSTVGSNGKTVAPILQDWTLPATSVTSADATAILVLDYSLTSQNIIDEICRPNGLVYKDSYDGGR